MAQLVASVSGVVLGRVVMVVGSSTARGIYRCDTSTLNCHILSKIGFLKIIF